MLTNNKKRSFVKLIALTLAALMVFSVCLTGCTDQDARDQAADALNKAEGAQSAADAAQTAEEVAAAIAKALEGYYKGSADDIKAIVTAELKDVVTADDLAKYAEKSALDALTTKVNGLTTGLTEAQVKELINKALADVAIDKKISDAIAGAGILSADDVKKLIKEALDAFDIDLSDYVKKDELDDYVTDEDLKEYFGDMTAEQIYAALDTMIEEYPGEHLSGDEWNKATVKVIETLNIAGSFINGDLIDHFYLDENKYLINTYSGIAMFPSNGKGADGVANTEDDSYGEYDQAAADAALAVLALKILRAPDVATIDAINEGFKKAIAVECWCEELEDVKADLYALGAMAVLDNDMNDTADKYGAAAKYHGNDYAKDAEIKYQVITDADAEKFAELQVALDALILAYAEDLDDETTNPFAFNKADIYVQYELKKEDGTSLGKKLVKAVDYKGNAYSGAAAVDAKTLDANAKTATLVEGTYTVRVAADTVADVFAFTAPTTGKHMVGYFDDIGKEPAIKVDAAGYTVSGKLATALSYGNAATDVAVAETYAAIIQMLADVDAAMKVAKDTFYAFLKHVAGVNTDGSLKADSVYEEALKDYMCTHDNLDGAIYVPADWAAAPEYLLDEVKVAFNYAANIRGGTTDGLYEYDLYEKLVEIANELLFEQYRDRALDVLNIMMNDYITAVEAARLAVANGTSPEAEDINALIALGLSADDVKDANEKWSVDFVDKFYAADGKFSWKLGTQNQKMIGLNQFLTDNMAAAVPAIENDAAVAKDVVCDILKVLAENAIAIKHELSAATIGPRDNILTADVADLEEGADVTKAFNDYLDTAKKNMDEIIYRWTFAEIKEGVLNSLYALVTGDVAFDDFFANGIAHFYNDGGNAAYNDAIAKALQNYLTGYAKIDGTFGVTITKDADGKVTDITAGEGVAVASKNLADKQLPAGLVAPDQENPDMIYAATDMVAEVLDVREAAVLDMENIAIKLRFGDYLDEARRTLWFTYHAYKVEAKDYAMSNAVTQAYNDALNEISGIEYKAFMADTNELDEYKQLYIDLLNIVMRHDSTYAPLLGDKTVAQLISAQAKSKDATGYTDIVAPTEPFAGAPAYYSAGTAISHFDQIFNAGAYKMDGTNKVFLYPQD